MYSVEHLREKFNSFLGNYEFVQKPEGLYEPVDYIMKIGGKRIRPILVLMANDLFGGELVQAMNSALALEVFHNFTLVHDDIMDEADTRRGKATVHKKFGRNTAILSGDVMLIKSYGLLGETKDELLKSKLFSIFTKLSIELCEGQQLDMEFEERSDVSVEEYLHMIHMKTGVLIAGALEMGALTAGASAEDCEHIYKFGKNIGIAFQLQDDLLDTFGTFEKVGKKIGGDIVQNKKTYLYLKAIELADEDQRRELIEIYDGHKNYDEAEKIGKVTKLFESLVVAEYARQVRDAYLDLAYAHLEAISQPKENKLELKKLGEQLVNRDF